MSEDIRPFPRNPLYEVSSAGSVRRIGAPRWLRPCVLKRGGYLGVSLASADGKAKTWPLHRVVAVTFLGDPPAGRNDVAHGDGNKANNSAENLRWASRAENEADKVRHGRSNRGERNGGARLTEEEVLYIRQQARDEGVPIWLLAEEYGVTAGCISSIASLRTWRHL